MDSEPQDSCLQEAPVRLVEHASDSSLTFRTLRARAVEALSGLVVEAVEAGDDALAEVLNRAILDPLLRSDA